MLVYNQLLYSGVFEVVKIQQSGLPCRLLHNEFVGYYRCLAPSRIRYSITTPVELVRVLRNHEFDLPHVQFGVSMTFFKSSEQRLLETKRDALLHQSAVRIQTMQRKVIYRGLYRSFIEDYRTFSTNYESLVFKPCETAFERLQGCAERFAHMTRYPVMLHVVNSVKDKLSKLTSRVVLIEDAKERLQVRSEEGMASLQDIVTRAIDLDMTTHATVIQCKATLQKYYRAIEFSDLAEKPSRLHRLTLKQIDEGIDTLREYADVLPGAERVIAIAMEHKKMVDFEIETLTLPMERAFGNALVEYEESTGNLVQRRKENINYLLTLKDLVQRCRSNALDKQLQQEQERRQQEGGGLVEDRDLRGDVAGTGQSSRDNLAPTFSCVDTKVIYTVCALFLQVMDQFVPVCDAESTMDFLQSRPCKEAHDEHEVFRSQVEEFRKWADIQMSSVKLRDALKTGYVSCTARGGEPPVTLEAVESLLERLLALQDPSESLRSAIRAGSWIVKVRSLLTQKLIYCTLLMGMLPSPSVRFWGEFNLISLYYAIMF